MPKAKQDLPFSDAIQERFGFQTPPAYQALERRGLFRYTKAVNTADLTKSGDQYLWLNEMEWYQPDDLRTFEFEDHHKPGFVPFAHTGGGDFWCWYPAMAKKDQTPVLLCLHDSEEAELFAPDFASAFAVASAGFRPAVFDPDVEASAFFAGVFD